jgi:predicted ArsR family transcriptional regulator
MEQQLVLPVNDARTLRAIAHPLREKLYYELFARGTARATDLAQALDVPVNQVSFHLRTMAKYGFIEEAPGGGKDRRERVWRPASELGFDIAPELITETHVQAARQDAHRIVDSFFMGSRPGPRVSRDVSLRLTEEEFQQLTDELTALFMRWNRSGQETPAGEDRQTYLANVYIQPRP